MPRPILIPSGDAGIARYDLGVNEEWKLEAGSVIIDGSALGGSNIIFVDYRDAAFISFYRQSLGLIDPVPVFISFAAQAGEILVSNAGQVNFPQQFDPYDTATVSIGVPELTLTPHCSLLVYTIPDGDLDPTTDPLQYADANVLITDLNLWVEDVGVPEYIPPKPLPPILVHAPENV